MKAQDPLEEADMGDGSIKRPTYISTKIDKVFKVQIIEEIQRLFRLGLQGDARFESRCGRT